jgi:asparagine synthase (glutamine-hydrolysing)
LDAEKSRDNVDPNTIRNILTLRYDSSQKPVLPKLVWNNFSTNQTQPNLDTVEKLIENYLRNKIGTKTDKIAIALSGGVDSTLVIAFLRRIFPQIKIEAISIRFANSVDETTSAAKIAEHFGANHHVVELNNYLEELPKAISMIKLPFWDMHWYYVVKKAQTLSKFLASGDGGDEVFGGYTFRYKKFLELTNEKSTPLEKIKAYLQCHERDRVQDQEKLFGAQYQFTWESIYELLLPYFDNPLSRLDQVFLADYNGKLLYNFSLVNSSLHNSFGLESVTPLLSEDLISYVIPFSNQFKYDVKNDLGKLLLRKLLTKYAANHLVTGEKLGFNVNTISLWKSYGQRLCKEYLHNARIVKNDWIDANWINKHIDEKDLHINYVNKFLGLLAFEIWYRIFVTKELDGNTRLN